MKLGIVGDLLSNDFCSVCDPFAHAPLKELTREMYGCLRNTQVLNSYHFS